MFDLHNYPVLTVKFNTRQVYRDWPTNDMLADELDSADYSHFDQHDALTVFDIEDGIEYHVGPNQVVRYRRVSSHTVIREFVEYEEEVQ